MDHLGPLQANLEPGARGSLNTLPTRIHIYSRRKGLVSPGSIYFPFANINPVFLYLIQDNGTENDISVFIVPMLLRKEWFPGKCIRLYSQIYIEIKKTLVWRDILPTELK